MYCTGGSKKYRALRPRQSHPMVCATFRLKLSKPIRQTATGWFTSRRLNRILRTPCPTRSVRTIIHGLQIFTPLKMSYNFTKFVKKSFGHPNIYSPRNSGQFIRVKHVPSSRCVDQKSSILKYVVHMSLFWHFLLWAFTVFAHDNFPHHQMIFGINHLTKFTREKLKQISQK